VDAKDEVLAVLVRPEDKQASHKRKRTLATSPSRPA